MISSQKLCELIVCCRYFSTLDKIPDYMKELASRREAGEVFPYEDIIRKTFDSLPTLQPSLPLADLRSILLQAKR